MRHGATREEVDKVISVIEEMGYQAQPMPGIQRTAVGLIGNDGRVDASRLEGLPGVHEVIHVTQPYKQVSREWKSEGTVVRLPGGVAIGGTEVVAIAGPCSVETERQIVEAARQVKEAGAVILRGGAWKPRSSPYSFQGLGKPGLRLLAKARDETGLLICTEAMDESGLGWVAEMADIVQIGARNMQNFSLLKVAGRCGKPVLLKRGISATVQELLLSAEYLLAEGNHDVVLCERGVRSFDTATRNLFDLTAIPVVHKLSHLPIIAVPSDGPTVRQSDVWSVLDRATASFDTVRTLSADFVQIIDNPMLGDPDTTRGRLYQRRPKYFAMHFSDPKNDRIVADGHRLWLYTPSTTPGQVIRTTIPGTGTTGPNLIGQFVEHPRERYSARYVRADSLPDGPVDVVALTPRAKDLPYEAATVWIAKRDRLVRRIGVGERTG